MYIPVEQLCCDKNLISRFIITATAEKLQDFFESFGEVTECNIMKDPATKKSRYVFV